MGKNGLDKLDVVDVAVASDVDALEDVIHFRVGELLAERGEDVPQLADTNVAGSFLVKHLEPADVVLGLAERLEPVRAVDNLEKRFKVDYVRKLVYIYIV